jgi:HlyD family type I secretion membrane fusion protein
MKPRRSDAMSEEIDHGVRGCIAAAAAVVAAFVACFGIWAAMAPLGSAVIASAVVKVDGNRKTVQHVEGGIVRELHVKEGDRVEAGQVLIVLDDAQARGTVELLAHQQLELRAQEARLRAEQAGKQALVFPADLKDGDRNAELARILAAQTALFTSRHAVLTGQIEVTRQKMTQTREQITGAEGQLTARRQQVASLRGELTGLRKLFEGGYVPRQRMLELERAAAALEGESADIAANIVTLRQSLEELELRIDQLRADRLAQVASELRDVQARLLELDPRLRVARQMLGRTTITAPSSGTVVGLTAFTIGGVIGAGERVMEIVPDGGELIVEATLNVDDKEDVAPGMPAEVHLVAYRQRSSPVVEGKVVQVSADRLSDARTGAAYYAAQVRIDSRDLQRTHGVHIAPGMPAMVIIPTGERTAMDYLLQPLTDSFKRAMREK